MILYHGSNAVVMCPRLVSQVRALDFGPGFYLTSDFEQAAKWARTTVLRRGEGTPTVSSFRVDEKLLEGLDRLVFDTASVEWLLFVKRNRIDCVDDSGKDVISGPVANDNTMPVLNLYFKGAYTEDEALRRLINQRLRDQYAFKTNRALACLRFEKEVAV